MANETSHLDRPAVTGAAGDGRRFHVATLGCKLNQFDSACAESMLRQGGYHSTDQPAAAHVILLNTCTVTARADAEARKLARRFRREAPSARIVATGCFAEREPDALRELGVLDDVVPLSERDRLGEALLGTSECSVAPLWLSRADRGRAYLRVQEGCHQACSYCVIPSVRGPGLSTPAVRVIAELRQLAGAGVREVGLTGVNTGSWGRDLTPRATLAELLEEILDADLPLRIRLNSLEPRTVTGRVVSLMEAHPDRIVPHVQIPLQSGCDRTLARMARNYRTGQYEETVARVVERVADVSIGADVITGFPGESERDFDETARFVERLPVAYLHVFSYSVRPGTRAADLDDKVAPADVKRRTATLREIGAGKELSFRGRLLGREFPALTLDGTGRGGMRRALTGNYVEALLPDDEAAAPGRIVPVRLAQFDEDGRTVLGEVAA